MSGLAVASSSPSRCCDVENATGIEVGPAYPTVRQRLLPLPDALTKPGSAKAGSPRASASTSAAVEKGPCSPRPPQIGWPAIAVPRERPNQSCFEARTPTGAKPLSTEGGGTVPSTVGPYQILLAALASTFVKHDGVAFAPPSGTHSTAASLVGS